MSNYDLFHMVISLILRWKIYSVGVSKQVQCKNNGTLSYLQKKKRRRRNGTRNKFVFVSFKRTNSKVLYDVPIPITPVLSLHDSSTAHCPSNSSKIKAFVFIQI